MSGGRIKSLARTMIAAACSAVSMACAIFSPVGAAVAGSRPLVIAEQGYFFVGGQYRDTTNGTIMDGQMYVQFQIPAVKRHRFPIVFIHGQGQSGVNFLGTPDGRAGWADYFLRRGYAVYVVDQPLRGRSAYHASEDGPLSAFSTKNEEFGFTHPEGTSAWPNAKLHTQWPGAGVKGDPIFDQFYASQLDSSLDDSRMDELNRDADVALLDKIGPAIVLTHSRSGPFGWLLADARPKLVKAIIAVEPWGSPFRDAFPKLSDIKRPWGITVAPITYDPPVTEPAELAPHEERGLAGNGNPSCFMAGGPRRTLPNLADIPVLIVTAEASYHTLYDACTSEYLKRAGVQNDWMRLGDIGIHGNAHMMMIERNNQEIAAAIEQWLDGKLAQEKSRPSNTGIDRFDIVKRIAPAFGGETFGAVGQYEVLVGRAHGVLDPRQAADQAIVGLDQAPRNARGLVEYAMDVAIARPMDLRKGSGKMVYEVINRGRGGVDAAGIKPQWDARFYLERGDVLVDSAWQGEFAPRPGALSASFPVVGSRSRPVIQRIRQEFVFDGSPITAPLGAVGLQSLTYAAVSTDKRRARLYVRQLEADPWTPLSADHFDVIDTRTIRIREAQGFDHGAIYDFVYDANNPVVEGTGLASVRDLVSYLKYSSTGVGHPLGDGPPPTEAYAFGLSQSGRFLKVFLWQGFNRDSAGRRVFDGLMPIVSGGRKGDFNRLFAQPGMSSNQHSGRRFPDNSFPFTYPVIFDPHSQKRDGLLRSCESTETCPKIIHLDSDNEMAAAFGWMVTTGPDGKPVELPANVRAYFAAGLQHGVPLRMPGCRGDPVEVNYTPLQHALFLALDQWVSQGAEPPSSRYPTLADGSLVSVAAAASAWPKIPGRPYSAVRNDPEDWEYRQLLPTARHSYVILTPRLDQDGNERDGVLLPEVAVPAGTLSGHTDLTLGYARGDQCPLQGEFIPFASTEAERLASGDPRRSLEERYPASGPSIDARRRAVAKDLIAKRLLLDSPESVAPSAARE